VSAGFELQPLLARLVQGAALSEAESEQLFESVISGSATPVQIGAALTALAMRGETVEALTGLVRVLRRHSIAITGGEDALDCCGTGGDGQNTLNISTAVAFVIAACGVKVAKHGNRAASSRSGAADVLGALGLNSEATPQEAERMLAAHGLTFMLAANHHPAMRAVAGLRRELGFRTLFNLAGPLANPAGAKRQLIGVYDARWVRPVAEVLQRLGSISAWVVHGSDGLDELTVTGPSQVAILSDNRIEERTVTPEDAGLPRAKIDAIRGGDPAYNAAALREMLDGRKGPYRDIVLLNAAAGLIVAGKEGDLRPAAALAASAIDNGAAKALMNRMANDKGKSL
jgi:anthranilate phosphoribosyltransferase